MRTWSREVEVDFELAHALVSDQFCEFEHETPVAAGAGWDNVCFLYLSAGVVFRFPTRSAAADLVESERLALPVLAERLPLPVPRPLFLGAPAQGYPFAFTGFTWIEGRTAETVDWDPAVLKELAPVFGQFLRALHSVPPIQGLPFDTIGKVEPDQLRVRMAPRRGQILALRPDLVDLVDEAYARFEVVARKLPADESPRVVVHGDLYPRHVLVHPDRRAAGVIDWGDVHLGAAATDLSLALTLFGAGGQDEFLKNYGSVGEGVWARARLRASMYGLSLLAYGLDTGDNAAENMGLAALRAFVELSD